MIRKYRSLIGLATLVLIGTPLVYYFSGKNPDSPKLPLATASRRGIKVVVSTNGVIEPVDSTEVYAPIDAFVETIPNAEGSEIIQGQILMRLESKQIRTAHAEAKAALLEARRQAQIVVSGPPKEEVSALDATIAEYTMQLSQLGKDLRTEESLCAKGASSQDAVDNLRKQRDLVELRAEALKQKKQDIMTRYSPQDKEWEQEKVAALASQVALLEQQVQLQSIVAPKSGLLYSLLIKPGAYVIKGQLLAQIYRPGKVFLRAYVDEPDLGRIQKGQQTLIEWDGLPNRQWTGAVEKPAEQVVAMNSRSVGYVLCSIIGDPKELIPNLNVKVSIVTASKIDALVVPRSAVISHDGKPVVVLLDGTRTIIQPVELGLHTPEEIEILDGINAGDRIVLNPDEAQTNN
jgi:HlyD family secretion protein